MFKTFYKQIEINLLYIFLTFNSKMLNLKKQLSMDKIIFYFYVISLITSCSIPIMFTKDTEFAENIQEFESLYNVEVNVSVIFTEAMPDQEFGLCKYFTANDRRNIVYIDQNWWNNANFYARQQLLFHEFGHCIFGLKHNNKIRILGDYINAPVSIMYPMPFGEFNVYRENLKYYYDELDLERDPARN